MASTNQTVETSADGAAAARANSLDGTDPDNDEHVRVAAYFIYENNGRRQGHALEDWVAAQAQLRTAAPADVGSPEAAPKA